MNFEYFIAKRIVSAREYKNSISSPIIKIAIVSIAIGFITMLISIATGVGLQKKFMKRFQPLMEISLFQISILIFLMTLKIQFQKHKIFILNLLLLKVSNTYKLQPLKEELLERQQILKELL